MPELEQHSVTGASGEYTRDVWLLPCDSAHTHPLCIFLDAELYLKNVEAVPVLTDLMTSGAIPQMTIVFVSHVNGAARHVDYTWNEGYTKFIAEDVVRWAKMRDGKIQKGDHLVCGLSLSGLAAAYIALKHPAVFTYALCQSGSFWWLHGKEDQFALPRTKGKFWLSVGDKETQAGVSHAPSGMRQEISQIEGVERAVRMLESLGAEVKHSVHAGGHAAGPWREELPMALGWFMGRGV